MLPMHMEPVIDIGFGFLPQSLLIVHVETGLLIWTQSLLIFLVWLDSFCQESLSLPSKSCDDQWATILTWQSCGCWRSKPGRRFLHFLSHFLSSMAGKSQDWKWLYHSPALSKSKRYSASSAQCKGAGGHAALTDASSMAHTYSYTHANCVF